VRTGAKRIVAPVERVSDVDARAGAGPLQVLRTPYYGRVWLSNLLHFVGSQVQLFALQWFVTDVTASRTILGLVTTVQGTTVALASPAAGVAADRLPRRGLLVGGRAGLAAGVLAMVALARMGWLDLPAVFAFAVGVGLLAALSQPAALTYVFDVVGRERAQSAVALHSAGIGLGQMAGPALAGVGIAVVGVTGSWLAAAAALGTAALLLVATPIRGDATPTERHPLRELQEGFAYVWATPPLRIALAICSMAFFNGALAAMRPVFARHVLEVGSQGMGWMAAAAGTGNLLGAVGATLLPTFRRPGLAIGFSMLGFSACIVLYAFALSLPYVLAVEFASGLCAQLWQVSSFSGLQLAVPERLRGRVMGILFTVVQLAPMGGVFVGSLADRVGDQLAMGIFGAVPMALTALLLLVGWRSLSALRPLAGGG